MGGSGFLAAFAAGVVIAQLDVELCDCFLDYGQATAEMFLLFTFVAFGAWLIWSGFAVADGRHAAVRPAGAGWRGRWCCCRCWPGRGSSGEPGGSWPGSGPRGLSSLLLILLPVFAGVPGSERLFAITCLVVLLSVRAARHRDRAVPPEERGAVHRRRSAVTERSG